MTTVADLNIKVDVDGAGRASVQLRQVGKAVDEVGDEAAGASAKVNLLSASMTGLATATAAAGGLAILGGAIGGAGSIVGAAVSALGGAIAALSGGLVAAGGLATIGVTIGVAATQALKLGYGVDTVGEAFAKLMKEAPIKEAMDDLNKSFKALFPTIKSFATGIIPVFIDMFKGMVDTIAPYIGRIGKMLADEAKEWGGLFTKSLDDILPHAVGWVRRISDIFQRLWKTIAPAAVPGMNALLDILSGLERGISAIIRAGRPLIDLIGQGFGRGFQQLGEQIARIVRAFGPAIGPLFRTLRIVFRGIADAFVALAPHARTFFDGLNKGLDGLVKGGGMKALGDGLGLLAEGLGFLLAEAGPLIGTLAKELVPTFKAFRDVLKEVAPILGKALVDAIKAIAPVLPDLVRAFGDLLKVLLPLAAEVLKVIGPHLDTILIAVLGFKAAAGIAGIIGGISGAIKGLSGAAGTGAAAGGGAAAGLWGMAAALAAVAVYKTADLLAMPTEQGKVWANDLSAGTKSLSKMRDEADRLRASVGSFEDPFDLDDLAAAEALENAMRGYHEQFKKYVGDQLTGIERSKEWRDRLREASGMTLTQKSRLAGLLVQLDKYNVELTESERWGLNAALATGDVTRAFEILNGASRRLTRGLGNLKALFEERWQLNLQTDEAQASIDNFIGKNRGKEVVVGVRLAPGTRDWFPTGFGEVPGSESREDRRFQSRRDRMNRDRAGRNGG